LLNELKNLVDSIPSNDDNSIHLFIKDVDKKAPNEKKDKLIDNNHLRVLVDSDLSISIQAVTVGDLKNSYYVSPKGQGSFLNTTVNISASTDQIDKYINDEDIEEISKNIKITVFNVNVLSIATLLKERVTKNDKTEPMIVLCDRLINMFSSDNFKESQDKFIKLIVDQILENRKLEDKNNPIGKIKILIDLEDWYELGIEPVRNKEVKQAVNSELFRYDKLSGSNNTSNKKDIFGENASIKSTFPSVTLAGFGKVILMSRASGVKFKSVYGTSGLESCPISDDFMQKSKDAMDYIFKAENKGILWNTVDEGKTTKHAYVAYIPISEKDGDSINKQKNIMKKRLEEQNYAKLRHGEMVESESGDTPNKFKDSIDRSEIKNVIRSLEDCSPQSLSDEVHMLSMCKVGSDSTPSPKKSIVSNVEEIGRLLIGWNEGIENCDNRRFVLKEKNKEKAYKVVYKNSYRISMLDYYEVLNKMWSRNGNCVISQKVPAQNHDIKFPECLDVFMGEEYVVDKHLKSISKNHIYLLIDVSKRLNRREDYNLYKGCDRLDVTSLLPIIGILLHKKGIILEDYRKEPAYRIGQLLNVLDKVQVEYCKSRKKSMPAELLGSKHINGIMLNPKSNMNSVLKDSQLFLSYCRRCRSINIINGESQGFFNTYAFSDIIKRFKDMDMPNKFGHTESIYFSMGYYSGWNNNE